FAKGTLEGAKNTGITLSPTKVFACADRVVVVEGNYSGTAVDSGATYPVKGPFVLRAIVDASGAAHTNLLHLSTTRGVRAGALGNDCAEPATYHFANRPHGIVVFPAGLAKTTMQENTVDELKFAGWPCPSPDLCGGGQDAAAAGFLAEAYTRLRPGWGLQLVGGRLWKMTARGYRIADHPFRSGAVALHATVDMAALTGYIERKYFRFAAGPGLVRSAWYFDSSIPRADSLGFNSAKAAAVKPALVASGSFVLPVSSRVEFEVTAVGDATASFTPPSILEFQPGGIKASGVLFAIGLGIRP
ncbi:MAG: hypothetical protein P8Z36_17190, partial [Gemmatimonadota bacterium]